MLKTKLYRPPLTREHICRNRLINTFEQNMYKPFSLVCAPAGYGKSMLISSWLENCNYKYVWISLSEDENDLKIFLSGLQMAIENVFPNSLGEFADLLQTVELPPTELLADTLINELDQINEDYVLVLDDYHLIRDQGIHSILDTMLQFPPEHIHIVISTRRDPPLKLNTLRLHNRINEIRTDDLGFNHKEITSLFAKSLKVNLELPIAITLEVKTEGWITALRLMSLTYYDWKDNSSVLNKNIEDTFLLTEYLVDEVLKKQPPVLQILLLKISILDRFCDELIEVILQSEESSNDKDLNGLETINWLLKSDLFLIKLDSEGKWFRFQYQFQYLLQKQLKRRFPVKEIHKLHLDVSDWLLKNEYFEEAFYHVLKMNNNEMAVGILINNRSTIMDKGLWHFLEICINKLPAQIIDVSPELLIIQAWVYHHHTNLQAIALNIAKIEKLLKKNPMDTIEGEMDFFKGYLCYYQTRHTEGGKLLKNAIKKIPHKFSQSLGEAESQYALNLLAINKKSEAIKFLDGKIRNQAAISDIRLASLYKGLSFINLLDTNLSMARTAAAKVKEMGRKRSDPYIEGWGKYAESLVMFNQGIFTKNVDYFSELTEKNAGLHTRMVADCFTALLLHHQLGGRNNEMKEILDKFREFSTNMNDAVLNSVLHSAQSRLALLQGDIDSAIQFLRMTDFSADEGLMLWWIEVPRITICRVLIADGTNEKLNEAILKLNEYCAVNDKVCNTNQNIGIKLLLALAYHKLGEKETALKKLTESIEMARLGDWVLPFIECGDTLQELLPLVLANSKKNTRYIQKILKTLKKHSNSEKRTLTIDVDKKVMTKAEKISRREKEILHWVSKGLRNKEIAHKLFVAEGTIKKHVYNMGQKFDASTRVGLLNRTRILGLIE